MRAVFSLDLQRGTQQRFPADDELLKALDDFGFGFGQEVGPDDVGAILEGQAPETNEAALETLLQPSTPVSSPSSSATSAAAAAPATQRPTLHYRNLAEVLFREMPEVAAAERKAVLYVGYVNSGQTPFLVTRMVPSQVTFRLLHRELPRLQGATETIIKRLFIHFRLHHPFTISDDLVRVYERKLDHVIITGRVVTNVLHETIRSDLRDTLLFSIPLILFGYTFVTLLHHAWPVSPSTFWQGTLERLNTALLTTALVSLLGLVQTYIEIRRGRFIDWSVHKDRRK